MLRTQISLTENDREVLDAEAQRSGRSVAALIRSAVQEVYGADASTARDLAVLRSAAGSWEPREQDGEQFVEGLRSGRRVRRDEA
jgi:hypothetical protein